MTRETPVYRVFGMLWRGWMLVGAGLLFGCLAGMLLVIVFDEEQAVLPPQIVEVERKLTKDEQDALAQRQEMLRQAAYRLARVAALDQWSLQGGEGPQPDAKAFQLVREAIIDNYGEGVQFEREWDCIGCSRWGPGTWGWVIVGKVYGGSENFNGDFKAWVQYRPSEDHWSMPRLYVKGSRGDFGMVIEGPLAPTMEDMAKNAAKEIVDKAVGE